MIPVADYVRTACLLWLGWLSLRLDHLPACFIQVLKNLLRRFLARPAGIVRRAAAHRLWRFHRSGFCYPRTGSDLSTVCRRRLILCG